jgi:hypothetical protein
VEFLSAIIEACKSDILFDDFMLDTLITWLTALSSSGFRAFRHTATVAGMINCMVKYIPTALSTMHVDYKALVRVFNVITVITDISGTKVGTLLIAILNADEEAKKPIQASLKGSPLTIPVFLRISQKQWGKKNNNTALQYFFHAFCFLFMRFILTSTDSA